MDKRMETPTYKMVDPDEVMKKPDESLGKRKPTDLPDPSPRKRPKLSANTVEAQSISEALMVEAKLAGKDAPVLRLRANHATYLVNNNVQKWTPSVGYVCGFGRGSFKLLKSEGADVPSGAIEFKLTNQDDMVVVNGPVSPWGQVLREQRS